MTVYIQNTAVTNTFDFWRNRTNELAVAMSNSAVTVDSNTAVGNAAISGTLTSNSLTTNTITLSTSIALGNTSVNAAINSTSMTFGSTIVNNNSVNSISGFFANTVKVGNSSVNVSVNSSIVYISNSSSGIRLSIPTAAQVSNAQYYFNANGSWSPIAQPVLPVSSNAVTTTGTGAQLIDSYAMSTFNAAEYLIAGINNSANGYSTAKLLTYHNYANGFITEYATMNSNNSLGVFVANTDGTNLNLYFLPVFNSVTIKFSRIST